MINFCVTFSERFSAQSPKLAKQHKSDNRSIDQFVDPLSSSVFDPNASVAKNCEIGHSMSRTSIMRMAVAHQVVDEKIGGRCYRNEFDNPGD